jgi:hypothetical protein
MAPGQAGAMTLGLCDVHGVVYDQSLGISNKNFVLESFYSFVRVLSSHRWGWVVLTAK